MSAYEITERSASTQPCKVFIYLSHLLLAEALGSLLNTHYQVSVLGSAGSLAETIRMFSPDVALVDSKMLTGEKVSTAERVRILHPALPLILLSMEADSGDLEKARQWRAKALLPRITSASDLINTVAAVLDGRTCIPTQLQVDIHKQGVEGDPTGLLTSRQIEVLRLIAAGFGAKDIANRLRISVRTAEFHRAAIMSRLDMHSTAALTRYAIANQLA